MSDDVSVIEELVVSPLDVTVSGSPADKMADLLRRRQVDDDDNDDEVDDYLRSNYAFEMQLCERVSTASFIYRLFTICLFAVNKLTMIRRDSHHKRSEKVSSHRRRLGV